MKRTLKYLSLICILISIPLTASWATWEGNAGIASASEFPGTGMYARSDMFPRNTIVEIRNLETGSTVRAVITGSSGVPGLVAVLSPDTAAALNIRDGSVVRVRIKIPSPVTERPAVGTIQTEDALAVSDPDVNPRVAVASEFNSDPVVPLSSIAEAPDSPMMSVTEARDDETLDDAFLGANESVSQIEEPDTDTDIYNDEFEKAASIAAETDMVTPTEETPVPESSDIAEVFYDEPGLLLPESEMIGDTAAVPDTDAVAETEVNDETVVMLEPAEPRVPEVEFDVVQIIPPVFDDPLAREALPAEIVEKEAIPLPKTVFTNDFPWIDQLTPGGLYVQIATYADVHNVRTVLDKYGKKYPLCVLRTGEPNKQLLKMLIGPVKKDEYGAVLEFFQKNGFKDAFVKRGK